MTTTPVPVRRAKRRPNGSGKAPKRDVRIPDDEWSPAAELAAARGETMGLAIRWGLEEYRRTFGTLEGSVSRSRRRRPASP